MGGARAAGVSERRKDIPRLVFFADDDKDDEDEDEDEDEDGADGWFRVPVIF